MWLIAGLGNPGRELESSRHNVGFRVVDRLARRGGAGSFRARFGAELAEAHLGSERLLLCKPMEFMNASGQSVSRAARFWKVPIEKIVAVHDDIDLPFARIKLGAGGGHGGHNGLRSLIADLGGQDFPRVRVGIGRPPAGRDAADWVLGPFSRDEEKELAFVVEEAADAVEAIVGEGIGPAMNRFNVRKKQGSRA